MIAALRNRPEILAGFAAICLIVAAVFAARAGLGLAEIRGQDRALAESELRAAELKTPPAPAAARPLVAGRAASLEPRVGEVLNVRLGELGLAISGVDSSNRRPFAPGLEALSVTVRGRGDTAAGLKALAWLEAHREAIAVESVQAFPAEGGGADWTLKLLVLVAPSRPTTATEPGA